YKIMQDFFPAQIPLAAYAKGKDVLYSKYRNGAVSFASDSAEKMLLMKIRDEAHRFALSYHRNLRGRGITASKLENIPGLGQNKIAEILNLINSMGSSEDISQSDFKKIEGIGDALSKKIYDYLKPKRDK
ncbi:MAG: hypothetical protein PHQ54_04665, partial [Candidatus Omnitrophica bacterium]|nr:hypothetical protein [Candidatus Omnitrophota bacterium]